VLFTVNQSTKKAPTPEHKFAIVSIVIGELFETTWERLCRKGWERHANAYGYDIILINGPLDTTDRAKSRSPAWQKLLILSQPWSKKYERIIWVDADIMITPFALNLLDYCPDITKVGISESNDRLSVSEKHLYLERIQKVSIRPDFDVQFWLWHNQNQFQLYDITAENAVMYNTGVLVLSPKHHEKLFLEVYEQEEKGRLYEQPYLSYVLDERGLTHKISPRFNWGILETLALYMPDKLFKPASDFTDTDKWVLEYLIRREYNNAYFLHFYGSMGIMANLPAAFD